MKIWKKHHERRRTRLLEELRPGRDYDELQQMIARAEAIHSDQHRLMLQSIIGLAETRARELMAPRLDVKALDCQLSIEEAEKQIVSFGVSRVPLYQNDLDNIIGIIHAWDIFTAKKDDKLRNLMHPCLKVPETQLMLGLLRRMKKAGTHLAILTDEYGSTSGLVTLSDLLVEIVGPVGDDEEVDDDELIQRLDNAFIIKARMHVEDVARAIGKPLPEGEYDSIGGLLLHHCERIPEVGEVISLAGLKISIIDASLRRIRKIKIEL